MAALRYGGAFLAGFAVMFALLLLLTLRHKPKRRAAPAKREGKKRHIGTMDMILFVVFVCLLLFTVKMINLYETMGGIPDTLCTCVFSALGGECGVMGWIKTNKDRQQDRKWQKEDERNSRRMEE